MLCLDCVFGLYEVIKTVTLFYRTYLLFTYIKAYIRKVNASTKFGSAVKQLYKNNKSGVKIEKINITQVAT